MVAHTRGLPLLTFRASYLIARTPFRGKLERARGSPGRGEEGREENFEVALWIRNENLISRRLTAQAADQY